MKKQDMKVGMHVAVGRQSQSRFAGRPTKAAEAYILVLPTGQMERYRRQSTAGKVGLAYLNPRTGKWEPRWTPSVEISHADWDTYSVEWDAAEKARDKQEADQAQYQAQKRVRQENAAMRLEALGITGFKYRPVLDLEKTETLLALLDEARSTAETMRREWEKHYPASQHIALPWEIDVTDEDEPLTGATT